LYGFAPEYPEPSGVQDVEAVSDFHCELALAPQSQIPPVNGVTLT